VAPGRTPGTEYRKWPLTTTSRRKTQPARPVARSGEEAIDERPYRPGTGVMLGPAASFSAASISFLNSTKPTPPLMAWPLMKKNGVPSTPSRLPS